MLGFLSQLFMDWHVSFVFCSISFIYSKLLEKIMFEREWFILGHIFKSLSL